MNWNILVTEGKESKSDSLSSGERKGTSLNYRACLDRVVGQHNDIARIRRSNWMLHLRGWKSRIRKFKRVSCIPSSMGHVKSRVNLRGPPRKAKYSWMTDSATVPWGKGEKNPGQGSEIEYETVSLQAVEGCWHLTACLLKNEPATYR